LIAIVPYGGSNGGIPGLGNRNCVAIPALANANPVNTGEANATLVPPVGNASIVANALTLYANAVLLANVLAANNVHLISSLTAFSQT
jgi:hypothetical protein